MENIKKAIFAALGFKEHDAALKRRATEEYYKYFRYDPENSLRRWFNGYEVIDGNTLRVKYQYGGGDMEMDGHFDVKI